MITLSACDSKNAEFSDETWAADLDSCPADVIPVLQAALPSKGFRCDEQPEACWQSCRAGEGLACYQLALVEQRKDTTSPRAQALFFMSCELGIDSGCTNRAARIYRVALAEGDSESDRLRCANRTFEEICDRGDSWACTMLGLNLTRGIGIPVDYERALEVLHRSCTLGRSDEACQAANAVAREARSALGVGGD